MSLSIPAATTTMLNHGGIDQLQGLQMLVEELLLDMLCHDVCSVVGSPNSEQLNISSSQPVLNPQVGYGEVPHPTQPSPSANTNGCSRIRETPEA